MKTFFVCIGVFIIHDNTTGQVQSEIIVSILKRFWVTYGISN